MRAYPVIPDTDLPDWIRSAQRGFDWGRLLAVGVALLVGVIALRQPAVSLENASVHDAFRTADVIAALQAGDLYLRWSPHAVYGFGAPVPHFTPPLAAHLPAILVVLLDVSIPLAFHMTILLALAVGSTATYGLVLHHLGARAALVSAVLYVTCPALAFTIPVQSGSMAPLLSAALLPLTLWAADRALRRVSAADSLLLAASVALVILSEPRYTLASALIGVGMLAALRHPVQRLALARCGAGIAAGLGLSAFFWLPALVQAAETTWSTLPAAHPSLLTLVGVLSPLTLPDPALAGAPVRWTLGIVLAAVLAAALARCLLRPRAALALLLPATAALISLLASVWMQAAELLTGAALGAALAGGALTAAVTPARWQRRALLVLCVSAVAALLPLWMLEPLSAPLREFSARAQLAYELREDSVAGVPDHTPIPSTRPLDLPPDARLVTAYHASDTLIDRVQLLSGSRGMMVLLSSTPTQLVYALTSVSALEAQVLLNPFSGWTVRADGRQLPQEPRADGYRVSLTPTRAGELVIALSSVPLWSVAWVISAAGLFMALAQWRWERRRVAHRATYPPLLDSADVRLLLAATATLLLLGSAWGSGRFIPAPALAPGSSLQSATPLPVRTSSALQLLAYRLSGDSSASAQLSLYWRTLRPLEDNYSLSVEWVNTQGQRLFHTRPRPLNTLATRTWRADRVYPGVWWAEEALALPPGRYLLTLRVLPCTQRALVCDASRALLFFDERGASLGTSMTLPHVFIQP